MPAEAVSAVNRAGSGQHEQRAAVVLVQQPGSFAKLSLIERVVYEAGDGNLFVVDR